MSLAELMKLVLPPSTPRETGSAREWESVGASLGVRIPEDYQQLVDTYGTGAFDNFLWVYNPFTSNPNLNLGPAGQRILNADKHSRAQSEHFVCPYPLHPEPNGLYPWAGTDNGDALFWQWLADQMDYRIVIRGPRAPEWEEFQESITSFLLKLFRREIRPRVFPEDFPSEAPLFHVWPSG